MTPTNRYLSELPQEKKNLFTPIFGNIQCFYTVVYLIIRNQHITEQEKPDQYEQRLQVIIQIKNKVENIVNAFDLDGESIIADIASDYFEDFIKYKEFKTNITNEKFISIIQYIQQA